MGKTVGEVIRERRAGVDGHGEECRCERNKCQVLTDVEFAELQKALASGEAVKRKVYSPGYVYEIPDQTPVEIPVNMRVPETQEDMIRRIVAENALVKLRDGEMETPEEANDFDVDEPEMVLSDIQVLTMMEDHIAESKIVDKPKGGEENGGSSKDPGGSGNRPVEPSVAGGTQGGEPGSSHKEAGNSGTSNPSVKQ